MASRKDSRLSRIGETVEEYRDRRESNSRLANERAVVRALVKRLGAGFLAGVEREMNEDNELFMTCSWFNGRFSGFPVTMSCHDLLDIRDTRMLLNPRRRKNKLWTAWSDMQDAIGGGCGRYGLAFPVPSSVGFPYAVMHNAANLPRVEGACGVILESRDAYDDVVLESMDFFVARVLQVWEPT